jgi:hypothetical protein
VAQTSGDYEPVLEIVFFRTKAGNERFHKEIAEDSARRI